MVLSAFLLALALSIAATVVVVVRGYRLYQQLKSTGSALSGPLAAFEEKAGEIDRHLDAFETSAAELEEARARLATSRARLQVLLDEVERARSRLRWLRVFLPAR
jgi:chromosome segregation ATPase